MISILVIRRVIVLFKKCLQKFVQNEKIWLEFFNFLIKNNSSKILNREIGGALVKHPNNITFWKIAAYNELENNFNSITARQLMQKCIRLNKNNIDTYLEYFVFEIVFANKYLERKIIMSSSDNTEEKRLKIIDEINDNEKENNTVNSNTNDDDDITNLKIAEVIWIDTLNKFNAINNKNKITITDISLMFLSKLEQYARKTNYVQLENKIIQSILNDNPNNISIQLSILTRKLEKYSNENEYINYMISECTNLFNNTLKDQLNHLWLLLLKYILSRENKENLLRLLFKVLYPKLNLHDVFSNYDQGKYNLSLIEILTDSSVIDQTKHLSNKNNDNRSLNEIIYDIYISIIENSRGECIEIIFKIMSNLYNEDFDYAKIFSVQLTNQPSDFIVKYIKQVIILIPKIVAYDPDLQITLDYFIKLNHQLDLMKIRLDNQCYRCLYEEILRVVILKIIESKEIIDEYKTSIEYIKGHMSQKLINYDYVKSNIIKTFTKDQKKLIEEI